MRHRHRQAPSLHGKLAENVLTGIKLLLVQLPGKAGERGQGGAPTHLGARLPGPRRARPTRHGGAGQGPRNGARGPSLLPRSRARRLSGGGQGT